MPDAQCAANVHGCRKEAGMNKHNLTILYSRLSVDDDRDGESGSIQNQKMLLEAYAERNCMKPYIHIFDDGYSGTGWDRPGWQKVIEEIEAGRVKNLVCKNLDRLGRDYLRVGLLMELLNEKSITLIAVQDGIDTSRGEDDFTPFRAILPPSAFGRMGSRGERALAPRTVHGGCRQNRLVEMWVRISMESKDIHSKKARLPLLRGKCPSQRRQRSEDGQFRRRRPMGPSEKRKADAGGSCGKRQPESFVAVRAWPFMGSGD